MSAASELAEKKAWRRKPRNKSTRKAGLWECQLRKKREGLRLSMRDVAGALGLSVTGYWQIEHGGDPMLSTALKIADFFGCSVPDLWPTRVKP